jgi:ribosomal protein S27AE
MIQPIRRPSTSLSSAQVSAQVSDLPFAEPLAADLQSSKAQGAKAQASKVSMSAQGSAKAAAKAAIAKGVLEPAATSTWLNVANFGAMIQADKPQVEAVQADMAVAIPVQASPIQTEKMSTKALAEPRQAEASTQQRDPVRVNCPNCGSHAERHQLEGDLSRTQCGRCDYLMVMCRRTGRVVEAYAPGLYGM